MENDKVGVRIKEGKEEDAIKSHVSGEGFTEKVNLSKHLKEEKMSRVNIWGRVIQAEGTANAKTLQRETGAE